MPSIGPENGALLEVGRNCWKVEQCRRLSFLVDGKAYFAALESVFHQARHVIAILGWDFDSRVRLSGNDGPELGELLRRLVEERPELHVYVLIWRNSVFYGENNALPELHQPAWSEHPRIHFHTDGRHPVGGCHHDKIVCVDGRIAFVGGMDLTRGRWDDRKHLPDSDGRVDHAGESYQPVHDVQAVVDGSPAQSLYELIRQRWRAATDEEIIRPASKHSPWPRDVPIALRNHAVGISRTRPRYGDNAGVREVEAFNRDALASARDFIYIESQYFALAEAAEILAEQIARPTGPELVIVTTYRSRGMIEHLLMSEARDRLFAYLADADRHGRLRMFHPVSCPDPVCEIKVHSKVIAVDDRLLRVGSSNINSRSMGLDSECDLVLEPNSDGARKVVAGLRNRLIAEHLGVSGRRFANALTREGSAIKAIETLNNTGPRRLVPFEVGEWDGAALETTIDKLLDPSQPLDLEYLKEITQNSL